MNIGFDSLKNMSIEQINNIEDSIHRLNFCGVQDRSRNNKNTAKEKILKKSAIEINELPFLKLIPASFKFNWTKKEQAIRDLEVEEIFREEGVEIL